MVAVKMPLNTNETAPLGDTSLNSTDSLAAPDKQWDTELSLKPISQWERTPEKPTHARAKSQATQTREQAA